MKVLWLKKCFVCSSDAFLSAYGVHSFNETFSFTEMKVVTDLLVVLVRYVVGLFFSRLR